MEKKDYYVNGNVVREMEVQPARREERRSRQEIERIQRKKSRRNAARRNRERAMDMNRGHVFFLSVCVLSVALSATAYIHIQAQVSHRSQEISVIESRLNDLRADNDARYKSITSSVDMEHVKKVAIEKLGMSYPSKDQIVYYSVDKTSFMDQYMDIPAE